jgi:hypothetical protein
VPQRILFRAAFTIFRNSLHEFASEAETGKVVRSPVDNNIASVVEEPDMRLRRAFAAMAKADSFFIEIELGFKFDLQSRSQY